MQHLAIPGRPGHWQLPNPEVESSLAEVWTLGPTLTLPVPLGQATSPPFSPFLLSLPSQEHPSPLQGHYLDW